MLFIVKYTHMHYKVEHDPLMLFLIMRTTHHLEYYEVSMFSMNERLHTYYYQL